MQRVCGIQAEIADQAADVPVVRSELRRTPVERTRILTFEAEQEIQYARFAWFQHARTGDARDDAAGFHALDRRPQTVEIEV